MLWEFPPGILASADLGGGKLHPCKCTNSLFICQDEDELVRYGYLSLITNQCFVRSAQHYGLTKTKTETKANDNFSLEPY